MSQKPSVGRIVHVFHDGVLRPAIITEIYDEPFDNGAAAVGIFVFAGAGQAYRPLIPLYEDEAAARAGDPDLHVSAFWPPRV